VGMHDRHFAEGIVAEIDRYSDRYRINRRANRVPLNSVLKLTGASFPVELLGQGGVSPLTYTSHFSLFQNGIFHCLFFPTCVSFVVLIVVVSVAGRGRGRGVLPPGSTPWLLQSSLAKTGEPLLLSQVSFMLFFHQQGVVKPKS
jgi:hypothetical protein